MKQTYATGRKKQNISNYCSRTKQGIQNRKQDIRSRTYESETDIRNRPKEKKYFKTTVVVQYRAYKTVNRTYETESAKKGIQNRICEKGHTKQGR